MNPISMANMEKMFLIRSKENEQFEENFIVYTLRTSVLGYLEHISYLTCKYEYRAIYLEQSKTKLYLVLYFRIKY